MYNINTTPAMVSKPKIGYDKSIAIANLEKPHSRKRKVVF